MPELASRYGLRVNREGFASCPFHKGDNTPSLRIYPASFYCFACNAHGDVIDFVQRMEGCTFKEAFLSLGGDYGTGSNADRLRLYRAQKAREKRENEIAEIKALIYQNNCLMTTCAGHIKRVEPMSDDWCLLMEGLFQCLVKDEELTARLDAVKEVTA